MGSLIHRVGLLTAAGAIAVACGSSNSGDLLGHAHGSGGTSGAGSGGTSGAGGGTSGAGGGSGAMDAGPDSSTGGTAGSGGVAATGGASGSGASGTGGSGAAAGAGGNAGSGGSLGGTPGTIHCGAAPCTTNFNVCCVCNGCFPKLTVCYPKITGCTTGKPLYCDDTADCKNGQVCCAHFDPNTYKFIGASCDTSCPAKSNATLCVNDSECKGGTHCLAIASVDGFKACQ